MMRRDSKKRWKNIKTRKRKYSSNNPRLDNNNSFWKRLRNFFIN